MANIFEHRCTEEHGFLGDKSHLGTQEFDVEITDVVSIEVDFAFHRIVETFEELENGGFP